MKKAIVVICIFFCVKSQGQNPTSVQLADSMTKKMQDVLSLSLDEAKKVYIVNLEYENQKMIIEQLITDSTALKNTLDQLDTRFDAIYKSTFTDEKYALYELKKGLFVIK
jgi:hypothetical protein